MTRRDLNVANYHCLGVSEPQKGYTLELIARANDDEDFEAAIILAAANIIVARHLAAGTVNPRKICADFEKACKGIVKAHLAILGKRFQ